MQSIVNRRTALAAIGTVGTLAAIPAAAATTNQSTDRSAWDQAFRRMEHTKSVADADSAVFDKIAAAWEAGRPSMDAIHWREFSIVNGFGQDRFHVAYMLDVEAEWQDFLSRENKTWWAPDPAHNKRTKERRRAALDSVLEFRRKNEEHNRATGYTQAAERNDRLDEARYNAKWDLIRTPAPDGEALLWKLETLFGPDACHDGSVTPWSEEAIAPVMADARRLLSHGRA